MSEPSRHPFSMMKHAHDLEFYKDYLFSHGYHDKAQAVGRMLCRAMDESNGVVTWLTAADYNWALRILAWAESYRAETNAIHAR